MADLKLGHPTKEGLQGPASDLPETDFDKLYPYIVPVEQRERGARSRVPFGREFEFTDLPITNTERIQDKAQRFLNQYFPGTKTGSARVLNPGTGRFYGTELTVHDAMHDFANVNNTLRGEELITIAENIGATPLAARNVGLDQLTQQKFNLDNPHDAYLETVSDMRPRQGGRTLVQQRGAAQGSSLFRDRNRVESFLSPPITKEEFNTMAERGQEFYDQVHQNWNTFKNSGAVEWSDERSNEGKDIRKNAVKEFMGENIPAGQRIIPRSITQRITGGYNTNGIPYGNHLALMNAPLVPTVNAKLYEDEINKRAINATPFLNQAMDKEQEKYNSPEQLKARKNVETWDLKSRALMSSVMPSFPEESDMYEFELLNKDSRLNTKDFKNALGVFGTSYENALAFPTGETTADRINNVIGVRPTVLSSRDSFPITTAVRQGGETWGNESWTSTHGVDPSDLETFKNIKENYSTKSIEDALAQARKGPGTGFRAGVPIDQREGGRIYLNPANLGSNIKKEQYLTSNTKNILTNIGVNPEDIFLEAAAKVKQIEGNNKAFPVIKQAIRTGFNTTANVASSIPLFDPAFREALDRGDSRKAALQVAKEYATGAVAAPVVGAGMGVLQRVAPQAARVVAGGLGVARAANPIAVVSQLGGSSKITPRQEAYENQLRETKFKQAEAARKSGGKWSFPTPFGRMRIPELGLSESGGLFFR